MYMYVYSMCLGIFSLFLPNNQDKELSPSPSFHGKPNHSQNFMIRMNFAESSGIPGRGGAERT